MSLLKIVSPLVILALTCGARHHLYAQVLQFGPMTVLDIDVGETVQVPLSNGKSATVRLLSLNEVRDSVREALRVAKVRVKVNGKMAEVECGNYRLPVTAGGVQIDCSVTKGYLELARSNVWGLEKSARLRLWPAGSPWIQPGTYMYPAKQKWFATNTQMANEPSFVDGSEVPVRGKVYYHYGLDIGGAEKMVQIVSATDGVVVTLGKEALPEYRNSPFTQPSYDGVTVRDNRGWFHWYFHLASIDPGLRLGEPVKMGQNIGILGKEGSAGCWSHLHYEIRSPQPSGKVGIQEGYAFVWEAYQRQYAPEIIAVARPHAFVWVGESAVLDGTRSWSRSGGKLRYEWIFSDGTRARGAVVRKAFNRPGTYSEILKVTDSRRRTAYDFAVVQVVSRETKGKNDDASLPPTIHASYAPTFDLRTGEPVTLLVRTCRTTEGHEVWNFGDGSPTVTVTSDGCSQEKNPEGYAKTQHVFAKPGDYIVSVERANNRGEKATARLHVRIQAQ